MCDVVYGLCLACSWGCVCVCVCSLSISYRATRGQVTANLVSMEVGQKAVEAVGGAGQHAVARMNRRLAMMRGVTAAVGLHTKVRNDAKMGAVLAAARRGSDGADTAAHVDPAAAGRGDAVAIAIDSEGAAGMGPSLPVVV